MAELNLAPRPYTLYYTYTVSEQSESSRSSQCIHDDLIIPLKSVSTDLNGKVPPLVLTVYAVCIDN